MVDKSFKSIINQSPQKLEEKVLRAIFKNEDSLLDVIDVVTPEMFSVSEYAEIYTSMINVFKSGDKSQITDETVQLDLEGRRVECNPDIIKKLVNEPYTSLKIASTADTIKRLYQRRYLLERVRGILDKQEECPTDSIEILDSINGVTMKANELVTNGSGSTKACENPNDLIVDIQKKILGQDDTGLKTGFKVIDNELGGLKRSSLWCISADSQVGKSMLALQLALEVCKRNPEAHVLYYSLEMTKDELEKRAIGMLEDIEPSMIENPKKYFVSYDDKTGMVADRSNDKQAQTEYLKKIKSGIDKLREYNLFIDDTPDHNSATLEASVRKHQLKYGHVDLVIVDHVGILCSGTVSEEVSLLKQAYAMFKKMAKKLNCTFISLHQFSNELKNDELRIPNVFNLIGGSSVRHWSDNIVGIWRPSVYQNVIDKHPELKDTCDIIWQKVRGAKRPDTTHMSYNGYWFTEKAPTELQGQIMSGEVFLDSDGNIIGDDDE